MKTIIFFAIFLAGCVVTQPQSLFKIDYSIADAPQEGRIYIKYKNNTERPTCLDPANWPTNQGEVDAGPDRILLNVAGHGYPLTQFDTGYCPGCSTRVEPGQELVGFMKYADFQLPPGDYDKAKTLSFTPVASYCSRKRPK